jgi:Histidine kinase-, DNA gyrase B-, and HSP90-like ATPase
MNLILNAIEAMKETGGVLTVKTQLGEDGQLLVSVSDTGVGLPKERTEQIFDAFFTTKPQGSGMGVINQPLHCRVARRALVGHSERRTGRNVSFHSANRSRGSESVRYRNVIPVSLGQPRGDTDRGQGKPIAKKVVAPHHGQLGKYVRE